jgi:flap endonuclease-1
MAMYQFLIAVRSGGQSGGPQSSMMLTNEAGEVTSHIHGMFNRTIKMMTAGLLLLRFPSFKMNTMI